MESLAPIVIPTLNRYKHFKNCIESLKKCYLAEKTDVYVFLDYPLKQTHNEGYTKILSYLSDCSGFKSINVIKREKNLGAIENFYRSLENIFERHEKLIFTEDDNEFSVDFINFLNIALNTYENRNDIFAISGYNYPINFENNKINDIYLWNGFSAWGVGLWKNKWQEIINNNTDFQTIMSNFLEKNRNKFYFNFFKKDKYLDIIYPIILRLYKRRKYKIADSFLGIYLYENKKYVLFPYISRVKNYGLDGSGENCGIDTKDIFKNQELFSGITKNLPENINTNSDTNKVLFRYFKPNFKEHLKKYLFSILPHSTNI